ncbi:MAG TPA: hypothetical protein DEB31_03425 [Clostridiales bacterium]|nr:hypothetical protein [Clostridiales bacterium]
MSSDKFDERQLQIRGNIFKHGVFTAIGLLLANAFLQKAGILWASGFHQNILLLMLTVTVISVAFHVRGVYFAENGTQRRMFLSVFTVAALMLSVSSVVFIIDGDTLIAGGMLTDTGFFLVLAILFWVNLICGFACAAIEKRKNPQ